MCRKIEIKIRLKISCQSASIPSSKLQAPSSNQLFPTDICVKMFSKKFVTTFLSDSINARPFSVLKLFSMSESPIQNARLINQEIDYTVININPYTLEEQLIMYPVIIIHQTPNYNNTIIDIE